LRYSFILSRSGRFELLEDERFLALAVPVLLLLSGLRELRRSRTSATPATTKQTAPMVKATKSRMTTPREAATAGIHQIAKNFPCSRVRSSSVMYTPKATPASDKRSSKSPTTTSRRVSKNSTHLYYPTSLTFPTHSCAE
jgi:hypothetical protein